MTSDWGIRDPERAPLSHWELIQIKHAMNELRASYPESALVALVDEKIRLIEGGFRASQNAFRPTRGTAWPGGRSCLDTPPT